MSEQQFRITFQPSGRSVFVLLETKIIEAAGRAGMNINMPCGGQGTCGKYRIPAPPKRRRTSFAGMTNHKFNIDRLVLCHI